MPRPKLACSAKEEEEEKEEECALKRTNHEAPNYTIFSSPPLLPSIQLNYPPQQPIPGYPLSRPESRINSGKTDPDIRSPCKDFKPSATAYETPVATPQ